MLIAVGSAKVGKALGVGRNWGLSIEVWAIWLEGECGVSIGMRGGNLCMRWEGSKKFRVVLSLD